MRDLEILKFLEDEREAIYYCMDKELIAQERVCCNRIMKLVQRQTGKNKGWYFRCTTNGCRKEISVRKDSFFSNSHLSIGQILVLTFYFVMGETNYESLKRKTGICHDKTICDWLSFLREICVCYFINHPQTIGGVNCVVECDEALLVKRKYNLGRRVREQWVFMMYDVALKLGVILPVENRTSETLIPLMQQYILPGSVIYTDSALVYRCLSELGFTHLFVNHKVGEWINYRTGCTTNHVESVWQKVKNLNKIRFGTHRSTLASHLAEFMWLQKFGKDFDMFLQHIKEVYNDN